MFKNLISINPTKITCLWLVHFVECILMVNVTYVYFFRLCVLILFSPSHCWHHVWSISIWFETVFNLYSFGRITKTQIITYPCKHVWIKFVLTVFFYTHLVFLTDLLQTHLKYSIWKKSQKKQQWSMSCSSLLCLLVYCSVWLWMRSSSAFKHKYIIFLPYSQTGSAT